MARRRLKLKPTPDQWRDIPMRRHRQIVLVVVCFVVIFPAVAAADLFIAVYINPNDLSWASGQGYSLEEASRIAAESCGAGCRRAGWSPNACVALAIRNDSGTCWGSMWGNSLDEARRKALDICQGHGCSCTVIFSECYR